MRRSHSAADTYCGDAAGAAAAAVVGPASVDDDDDAARPPVPPPPGTPDTGTEVAMDWWQLDESSSTASKNRVVDGVRLSQVATTARSVPRGFAAPEDVPHDANSVSRAHRCEHGHEDTHTRLRTTPRKPPLSLVGGVTSFYAPRFPSPSGSSLRRQLSGTDSRHCAATASVGVVAECRACTCNDRMLDS
eukprot:ctg_948.g331